MILSLVLIAISLALISSLIAGAPPLATHRREVGRALDLAELQPGEHLLDLGCGYGGILIAAAKRGAYATGYEINPFVWAIAWVRTRRYGGRVSVRLGDFWAAPLAGYQVVFVFLLERHMARLEKRLQQAQPGTRVISYNFKLPKRRPSRQLDLLLRYDF